MYMNTPNDTASSISKTALDLSPILSSHPDLELNLTDGVEVRLSEPATSSHLSVKILFSYADKFPSYLNRDASDVDIDIEETSSWRIRMMDYQRPQHKPPSSPGGLVTVYFP